MRDKGKGLFEERIRSGESSEEGRRYEYYS
jgi:hypothetical protein